MHHCHSNPEQVLYFTHFMVSSSMPVSIWSYTCNTIPKRSSTMDAESILLISCMTDMNHQSQRMTTKCCLCYCYCCWCCFLCPNWSHYCHCFHWQAYPEMQKGIWLCWYHAGAQEQSSIKKMIWWLMVCNKKYFWWQFIILYVYLCFERSCPWESFLCL